MGGNVLFIRNGQDRDGNSHNDINYLVHCIYLITLANRYHGQERQESYYSYVENK